MNTLKSLLEQAGAVFRGNSCTCPFHNDSNPSAWIKECDNGWYFKCAVCDIYGDIHDMEDRLNGLKAGTSYGQF